MMYIFQKLLTRVQLKILLARLESWRLGLKAGVSRLETCYLCGRASGGNARRVKTEYFAVLIVSMHLVEAKILLFVFGVTPQIHARPCVLKITQFHELCLQTNYSPVDGTS